MAKKATTKAAVAKKIATNKAKTLKPMTKKAMAKKVSAVKAASTKPRPKKVSLAKAASQKTTSKNNNAATARVKKSATHKPSAALSGRRITATPSLAVRRPHAKKSTAVTRLSQTLGRQETIKTATKKAHAPKKESSLTQPLAKKAAKKTATHLSVGKMVKSLVAKKPAHKKMATRKKKSLVVVLPSTPAPLI